jgi:ribosomal-protein-alanine N-acetyltransferase
MSMAVILREYRDADLEAICRLDEACFAEAFRFDCESMREFAEARSAVALVAEEDSGGIAGFVIVHVEMGERRRGYVVTLDVAEEFRREGVASRLMMEVESRVGTGWMELHVFTGNEGAIRFYERMGYRRVGMRRRFYQADGLDAFLYCKELGVS